MPLLVLLANGCGPSESIDKSVIPIVSAPKRASTSSVTWFRGSDGRFGLRDKEGREVLKPTYDDARPFSEGMAAVNIGAEENNLMIPGRRFGGKWGYVDEAGTLVVPAQYTHAYAFSDGLGMVWNRPEGTLFFDRSGVIQLRIREGITGSFREGLAPVDRGSGQT